MHIVWTFISLFVLYKVSWEDTCLVKIGFPKPYMVFKQGSPEYIDQMSGVDEQDYMLKSLGDLYETYDFDRNFHFTFKYGPEETEPRFRWVNFQTYLQLLCMGTIFFEMLQIMRYFLMLQGYKMNKGIGLAAKSAGALLPLFGFITFFFETKYVLGFMGDTCFCKYKEAWE